MALVPVELRVCLAALESAAFGSLLLLRLQLFDQQLRPFLQEIGNHLLPLLFPKRYQLAKLINRNDFSLIKYFSLHVDFIVNSDLKTA